MKKHTEVTMRKFRIKQSDWDEYYPQTKKWYQLFWRNIYWGDCYSLSIFRQWDVTTFQSAEKVIEKFKEEEIKIKNYNKTYPIIHKL